MNDERKLTIPDSGVDPNQITIDLRGDHKWETILIHCRKPKFTKGQRLTSMREVYEACLAAHTVQFELKDSHLKFSCTFHENLGIIISCFEEIRKIPEFLRCEYWEVLE